MRLLILSVLLVAPAGMAAAAGKPSPQPFAGPTAAAPAKECKRARIVQARQAPKVERKPLGELPDGDLMLALHHQVEGCMEPIVVRYGVGRR